MNRFFYRNIAVVTLLGSVSLFPSCEDDGGKIEKDEGIYINELYAAQGEDWLEIYNSGSAVADVSGYFVYDDPAEKYALPSGTTIPAKGFLVVFCDGTSTGLHTNFRLSSTGETVFLENDKGQVIDKVTYQELKDGEVYGRFPDGSTNLSTSGLATQGAPNGDTKAPLIRNVNQDPIVPRPGDNVTITAEVLSSAILSEVRLFYSVNGGSFTSVAMTGSGTTYSAIIPALPGAGDIAFYIAATNSENLTTYDPFDAPANTRNYVITTDALPSLYINEFMASNSSCCPDVQNSVDEFDDWIEIFNAGSAPVNVGGMYLSDDPSDPFKNRIPDDDPSATTIPAGGFIVMWADEQGSQGALHSNFQLSADGEYIGLFYKDGRTIDEHDYGVQAENTSAGRATDGGMTWTTFTSPTPGDSND